jgi:hypothetical protein
MHGDPGSRLGLYTFFVRPGWVLDLGWLFYPDLKRVECGRHRHNPDLTILVSQVRIYGGLKWSPWCWIRRGHCAKCCR